MDTEPHGSPSIVEAVKRLQQLKDQQIKSGELVITPFAVFKFQYISDLKFQNSPNRDALIQLKIPERTMDQTIKVVKALDIKYPVTVISRIPNKEKKERGIIPSLGVGARCASVIVQELSKILSSRGYEVAAAIS